MSPAGRQIAPATRRLILVDLENQLGCSPALANARRFASAYQQVREGLAPNSADLVIVGVHPTWAYLAHDAAPGTRIVTRSGQDGAEIRLIAELHDLDFIRRRFDEVVIASGDSRFLPSIEALNRLGLATTVAARPGSLAACTRLAAKQVIWLAPTPFRRAAATQVEMVAA